MTYRLVLLGGGLLSLLGCLGDVEVPPAPPVLIPVTSPTSVPRQALRGTKPAGTAVLNDGEAIVPHDDEEDWSFSLPLVPGENAILLTTERPSGLASRESATANILYDPPCPLSPGLDAPPPAFSTALSHDLAGDKPVGSGIVINGTVVVPADATDRWAHTLNLDPAQGAQAFVLAARDAKGRDSDPIAFTVTYDVTAPGLAHRYPTAASDSPAISTGIATNTLLSFVFDEAINFTTGDLPPTLLTVTAGGSALPGVTTYVFGAQTIAWVPATELAPGTTHTVTIEAAAIVDLAGNAADPAGGTWTWTFDTGAGPSSAAPTAPSASAPASTATPSIEVTGSRDPWTAILLEDVLLVAPGPDTAWSVSLSVAEGENSFAIVGQSVTGVTAAGPTLTVSHALQRPAPPTVDPSVPTEVDAPSVLLFGTKPANTALLIGGDPVVCSSDETDWAYELALAPGFNDLRLQTRDSQGAVSDPVLLSVNFVQTYEGKVPPGWQLQVFVTLRDLLGTSVASEFVTGANQYGIDAWIEGPIAPGQSCHFDSSTHQRQEVAYVGTLSHYVGNKAQHEVPFTDDDYRGTDYLAALITGGVFDFLGTSASTPRRDANGREAAGLVAGVTSTDLRQRIDCFGLVGIDACTEATISVGTYSIPPWEPRRAPNAELLDQGDYLLWIQINLDRAGTWLVSNDFETCWGDPAHAERGMHRVVRRIALGSVPYTLELGASEELSGPDRDGSTPIKYLSDDGLRIYWGPP